MAPESCHFFDRRNSCKSMLIPRYIKNMKVNFEPWIKMWSEYGKPAINQYSKSLQNSREVLDGGAFLWITGPKVPVKCDRFYGLNHFWLLSGKGMSGFHGEFIRKSTY